MNVHDAGELIMSFVWGLGAGVLVGAVIHLILDYLEDRRLERRRSPHRPTVLQLELARLIVRRITEGEKMKVSVAVGAQMSREAWETVTLKLLDLVGPSMSRRTREGVQFFVERAGRAWPDLEQRAVEENPDAAPPPIG